VVYHWSDDLLAATKSVDAGIRTSALVVMAAYVHAISAWSRPTCVNFVWFKNLLEHEQQHTHSIEFKFDPTTAQSLTSQAGRFGKFVVLAAPSRITNIKGTAVSVCNGQRSASTHRHISSPTLQLIDATHNDFYFCF
jgi:hypothetical protein